MEGQIQGENVAPVEPAKEYVENVSSITATLEAKAKAQREASMKPQVPTPSATNATTEAPTQQNGNPPVAKATEANKPDSLQQFRDKDGNVDPQKIEKANEHLQKSIDSKDDRIQRLLGTNKELMQKHTKVSQDAKAAEIKAPFSFNGLTPELKQKALADIEKDPVEGVIRLAEMVAEMKTASLKNDFEGERSERLERARARELDDIGQNGNPWIYTTEGAALFDQAFSERPWLLQSKNPYKDALRFIDAPVKAQHPDAAPSVRSTPTLGGGRAVPPPSSGPTETPVQQLKNLKDQFAMAIREKDYAAANKIGLEIKRLDSMRFAA